MATDLKGVIQEKYGEAARRAAAGAARTGCCGTGCGCDDPITSNLYSDAETAGLPADAVTASLGCGNPTALLALEPGQTVLDRHHPIADAVPVPAALPQEAWFSWREALGA